MPEPRQPILPDGISDLYDLVQRQEEAERELKNRMSTACRWLVPLLIEKLSIKIDYDSIGIEERDLVLPLIREAAVEEFQRITSDLCHDRITFRMLDFLTEETWREMLHPGKNPIYKDLSPADIALSELALKEFRSTRRDFLD
jgi:hypothetical protein